MRGAVCGTARSRPAFAGQFFRRAGPPARIPAGSSLAGFPDLLLV